MMIHLMRQVLLAAILLGCADCSDEMKTLPAMSGVRGSTVELPCEVDRPVHAVYWYRHNSTGDPAATIVIQNFDMKVINSVGPRLDMTPTYSLVMRNITVEDETTYSCHVAFVNGDTPRYYINLTVIVLAEPLHPTVDHCKPKSGRECTYTVGKLMEEFELFPIVCRVSTVRPPVHLSWTSVKGDTHSEEYARRNTLVEGGFWNVSLGLKVSRYEIGRKFRCLAEGVGVKGSTEMIALLQQQGTLEPSAVHSDCPSVGGFIAATVIFAVAAVILLLSLLYHKFKVRPMQHYTSVPQPGLTERQATLPVQPEMKIGGNPSNDLQEIRENIKTYKPGAYARMVLSSLPKKMILGLYGVAGAGRSTLANSFIYSVTNINRRIETGPSKDGRGVTTQSSLYEISDNISIQDTVDLPKLPEEVSEVVEKMLDDRICCPIIVIGRNQDIKQYENIFRKFIKDVNKRLSFPPVFIVTGKTDDKGNPGNEKMIELITKLGGAKERIFFVNDILDESSDDTSKRIYLGILVEMLQVADDKIVEKTNKIYKKGLKGHLT